MRGHDEHNEHKPLEYDDLYEVVSKSIAEARAIKATRQGLYDIARKHGIPTAELLEVHPGRVWLLIPGTPTQRLEEAIEYNRPAGVQLRVVSFDDLDDIVAELINEAYAKGLAEGRARAEGWLWRWLGSCWRWLGR